MADYRTHLIGGFSVGAIAFTTAIALNLTDSPDVLFSILVFSAAGSVAPDIDSDTSKTLKYVFSLLTSLVAWITLKWCLNHKSIPWYKTVILTAVSAAFIWFVVAHGFKKITRHRGMAHSTPAIIISTLIVFLLTSYQELSDNEAFLISISFGLGYFIHLLLDEIYAGVNFEGKKFKPNKAFGTALKLYTNKLSLNLLMYGTIFVLIFFNYQKLHIFYDYYSRIWNLLYPTESTTPYQNFN